MIALRRAIFDEGKPCGEPPCTSLVQRSRMLMQKRPLFNLYRMLQRAYISRNPAIFPLNRTYSDICIRTMKQLCCELTKSQFFIYENSFFSIFFFYKEPIFWQKIPTFSYILNLNNLSFLSDFPKSGWDGRYWPLVKSN